MKSYFEYTEQERAAMTREQVQGFEDYALMEAGVVKPRRPPELDSILEVPPLEYIDVVVVRVKDRYGSQKVVAAFKNPGGEDAAAAFLLLNAIQTDYDYDAGSKYQYEVPIDKDTATLVVEKVIRKDSFDLNKAALKQIESNRASNERARSEYEKALQKSEQATRPLWGDRDELLHKQRECAEVLDTHREYLKLTDGNATLATTFLMKAFDLDRIKDAEKWFGTSLTTIENPEIPDAP